MAEDGLLSRRAVFLGAAGVAVAATFIAKATATDMNEGENANVKLVNNFLRSFAATNAISSELVADLADDCELRFPSSPQWHLGKAAALGLFEGIFGKGMRADLRVHESFAKGPVVVNYRSDAFLKAGKLGEPIDVVGFFIIRDSKIQRWEDIVLNLDGYREWSARNF